MKFKFLQLPSFEVHHRVLLACILFAVGTSIWIYHGGEHHHDTLVHNGTLYPMEDVVQDLNKSLVRNGEEKVVCYRESHRNFYIFIFQMCVVIVLLTSYGIYTKVRLSKRLSKQNKALAESRENLDKTNQALLAGIRYARRMQQAMLPEAGSLERLSQNSVLLYLPKDVVSGDFYWMGEVQGKRLFCVADCTGHGVPGAFLATIGLNTLQTVIEAEQLWEPAKILHKVNESLCQSLSMQEGGTSSDGIEMTIVCLDPQEGMAYFAGARGVALYVTNEEVKELKGDRVTLGHNPNEAFTQHSMAYRSRDWFFQFTDGFPDQFGGPGGKKFSRSRLRDTLVRLAHDPASLPLEETFMGWKGEQGQVDDVLVLGSQA